MLAFELSGANRPYIVVGDRTSKGGTVISGSEIGSIGGKSIARVGDQVKYPCNTCKPHNGATQITTGTNMFRCDGKAVAREGDMTACGGVLMSSGGEAYDEALAIATALGSPDVFDEQFRLVQSDGITPFANHPYKIYSDDGKTWSGITDSRP